MTQQTESADLPAVAPAAASEPVWFASYPPGIPKSYRSGFLSVAFGDVA